MAHYHKRIQEIKDLGPVDFMNIEIDDKTIVTLQPIDNSDETIKLLTMWRNQYWDGFLEKFTATEEGTKKWLMNQVVNNPDRILFMIFLNGEKIGHVGTNRYDEKTNSAELDNMIRGVRNGYSGLMRKIEIAMLEWMFSDLKLSSIGGRLWSDNYKMLNCHIKCGWLAIGVMPFKKVITSDGFLWEEVELKSEYEHGERYFLVIKLSPERFFALKDNAVKISFYKNN